MIRLTALWFVVAFVAVYAWRDWYRATCGLVLLMAVIEHPDMPKTLFGIQGLNPWNIAFASLVLAWISARQRDGLPWDLPSWLTGLLLAYVTLFATSFVRMVVDREALGPEATPLSLTSEYLINTIKWMVPGMMLFDGCRSEGRLKLGTISLLLVYLLLAVQVVRWLYPMAGAGGEELQRIALRILPKEVGYHRVNLSTMLAGASWAILAARALLPRGFPWTAAAYSSAAIVVAGQALTGGRTGYATWLIVGLVMGLLRWRRQLLLAPLGAVLVLAYMPGVSERMMQGFTEESRDYNPLAEAEVQSLTLDAESSADLYTVTSGRSVVWPYVVDRIYDAPLIGYGRQAMIRTGLSSEMAERFGEGEAFGHPHNAYLEWLLDNGALGMVVVAVVYAYFLITAVSLFVDRRSLYYGVIGGVTFALIAAQLIGSAGSQSFYPREGVVGLWCAIGLMMRVAVERKRVMLELARDTATRRPVLRTA